MLSTLLLPWLAFVSPQAASTSIEGTWAGGFVERTRFLRLEVTIRRRGNGYGGTLHLPGQSVRTAVRVRVNQGRVTIEVPGSQGKARLRFDGRLEKGGLRGRAQGTELAEATRCDFVRVVLFDKAQRERLLGRFRTSRGEELRIRRVRQHGVDWIRLASPALGLEGALYPVSEDNCLVGNGNWPLPARARLELDRSKSGRVEALRLRLGARVVSAKRDTSSPTTQKKALPPLPRLQLADNLRVRRRHVRIDAGDVQLAATLYLPPGGTAPFPAVVQLHGSAPTKRQSQWYYFTSTCLRSGLAVLAYDKRGCGDSTGTRLRFSVSGSRKLFDALASDAAAAHAWLRKQKEIDAERVGLVGGSQAGWIMPLVPAKTKGVRFVISACGPTVSAGEEQQHAVLLSRGHSLDEADRKLAAYRGPRGHDPRPLLRKLELPMLWLFGERDDVIPTRACLEELAKLRSEGHTNHVGHVFLDSDHSFRTPQREGVLLEPVIRTWLERIGVLR